MVRTFSRCEIVGRRFPICHVHVGDDIVEVCFLFLNFLSTITLFVIFFYFFFLLFE